jgi:hypothetical protein
MLYFFILFITLYSFIYYTLLYIIPLTVIVVGMAGSQHTEIFAGVRAILSHYFRSVHIVWEYYF